MLDDLVLDRAHPNHWFNRASDLRAAAGAVWFSFHLAPEQVRNELDLPKGFSMGVACRPVYHLLCGISLEVLMKGILAERGMTPPATHNLVSLACDVGLSLDDDDQRLFRYYQSTFIWGGRYPLPRDPTPDKLRDYWDNAIEVLTTSEPIAPGSFIHRIGDSGRTDWPAFQALYQRIEELRSLERTIRTRQDGEAG